MTYLYWIIIVVLLLFSAYFSAADMVYGIVDRDKLVKASKSSKTAKLALRLRDNYDHTISSILLGNNLVNILASSIVAVIGVAINSQLGATIGAIIFTITLIIFGEFFPKAIAKKFNYRLSIVFAYPTIFFYYLFFVFTWPISKLCSLFVKPFKKKGKEEDVISEDELDEMVDEIASNGELDENEAEIVKGAIDLIDIQAFEIMTPRVKLFAIDIDEDIDSQLTDEALSYTRLPVYKGTIDNIIGILPMKRITSKLLNNEDIDISSLLYKPIFIPRNYQIIDLLNDFKKSKLHIAIVIDEYGGTEGIITMEDILEEVVGDIFDESDEVNEEVSETKNGELIIDGSMNLDDFFELINYNEEFDTDYSTVGGFCQEFIEGFAKSGDEFTFSHYKIKIIDADEFTVNKIKVTDIENIEDKK